MTVSELIKKLEKANPYLVVQVWDTHNRNFTDKFYIQSASFNNELLITPSEPVPDHMSQAPIRPLFDDSPPGQHPSSQF